MDAYSGFTGAFGAKPEAVFASPGRTELGGNHTDHQRGKVIAAAVDVFMHAAVRANGSGRLRVISEGHGGFELDLGSLEPEEAERFTSAAMARGAAAAVTARGGHIPGADIYVCGGVPAGEGLSSSSCFGIVLTLALAHCAGLEPGTLELARAAQFAENVYYGKPSGLMDQLACASGGVSAIDFGPDDPAVERLRLSLEENEHTLCLVYSGAGHQELTEEYAAIPREMGEVARFFGKSCLREVSELELYENIDAVREKCGDRAVLRAGHFFSEERRVEKEIEALRSGDFEQFLACVRSSGRSSAMYLQNLAVPGGAAQPMLIAQAASEYALRGRGAVRVHGGGFAGAVQAFVPTRDLRRFVHELAPLRVVLLKITPHGAGQIQVEA